MEVAKGGELVHGGNGDRRFDKLVVVALVLSILLLFTTAGLIGVLVYLFVLGETSDVPTCENTTALFTHHVTDFDQVTNIVPLGNFNPPGHVFPTSHMYFVLSNYSTLYSPGNSTLTVIVRSTSETLGVPNPTEYALDIKPCKDVTIQFGHVKGLVQEIEDIFLGESASCEDPYTIGDDTFQQCRAQVEVSLLEGQVLGVVHPFNGSVALDVGLVDLRVEPDLSTLSSFQRNEMDLYRQCPIDYFQEPVKSQMEAKIQGFATPPRVVEPICGDFRQTIPDRARGTWLRTDTPPNAFVESYGLTLGLDNFTGNKTAVAIGLTGLFFENFAFSFDPATSGFNNIDFADAVAGIIYCFDVPVPQFGHVLYRLDSNTALSILPVSGSSCPSPPHSFGAGTLITYYR